MQINPFFLLFFFFSNLTWNIQFVWSSETHVGDIQYSLLSEEEFQSLHGKEWELLRGQKLAHDSELKRFWENPCLPDGRGVFFRCANHHRDPQHGNPEGDVSIGTDQKDGFQSHNHGGGRHEIIGCGWTDMQATPLSYLQDSYLQDSYLQDKHPYTRTGVAIQGHRDQPYKPFHTKLFEERMIHDEGGPEKRPRKITLNAFVKVKETPPKTSESQDEITRVLNNPTFQKKLKNLIQSFKEDYEDFQRI